MENNIILSETVLSQTVLNASPSDIMLHWRIYSSTTSSAPRMPISALSHPPSLPLESFSFSATPYLCLSLLLGLSSVIISLQISPRDKNTFAIS